MPAGRGGGHHGTEPAGMAVVIARRARFVNFCAFRSVATVSSTRMTRMAGFTVVVLLGLSLSTAVAAAELQPRTVQAYERHSEQAVREFVARAQKLAREARRCDGVMTARAASGDGILNVPDGLIHNWMATAFVRGATLRQVVDVARDYPSYSRVYENVKSVKVLSQTDDTYGVLIRLEEGSFTVEVVLDVRSTVEYRTLGDGSVTATSKSDEIRQVNNAGRRNESLRPVGRDSGYLWRAHTLTLFAPSEEGVFVAMETLGLSRGYPPFTSWWLEPIARRLGRKSAEGSLNEFLTAIRRSAGLPTPKSSCS